MVVVGIGKNHLEIDQACIRDHNQPPTQSVGNSIKKQPMYNIEWLGNR